LYICNINWKNRERLMKNLLFKQLLLPVAALFIFVGQADAQCYEEEGRFYNLDGTPCTNTVVSAVPFLRIVADARSGAMGDAKPGAE
jgi:hypothetical protein